MNSIKNNPKYVYAILCKYNNSDEPVITIFDNENAKDGYIRYINGCKDKEIICCDKVPIYKHFIRKHQCGIVEWYDKENKGQVKNNGKE